MAGKCDWCGKETDSLYEVSSLGTDYHVCKSCNEAHISEVCIVCGEAITGFGSIKGKCYACSQEEYEKKEMVEEERRQGVDSEICSLYTSTAEFTDDDFKAWLTFSLGEFTPEKTRELRIKWLKKKLSGVPGWSDKLIDDNLEDLFNILDRHFSKLTGNKGYKLAYYDGKNKTDRIIKTIGKSGNIYVIETKPITKVK